VGLDGKVVQGGSQAAEVPPGTSSAKIASLDLASQVRKVGASKLVLSARFRSKQAPESTTLVLLARPKDLDLSDPSLSVSAQPARGGFLARLASKRPALWSWVELEGAEAEYSDNFLHVLPGEPQSVLVTPKAPM
jgi:beta-mannosidase